MEKKVGIVIIGAGLTGLTTAHYLSKKNKDFIVVEEKDRIGGVIETMHEDGFTFEKGPNTGVLGNADIIELLEELKDLCTCQPASKSVNKRYILKNGMLEPMPMNPVQAIRTPLYTTKDKFRILAEPFQKRGTDPEEPLSEMVKRRMGQSFLDYAIDPFILGVYAGDPSKLITKYAFPKLYNLEQTYGSFIIGSIKKKLAKKDDRETKVTREVFSVKGGLSEFTQALYRSAGEENFLLNISDLSVTPENKHFIIKGRMGSEDVIIKAQKVINTTGAFALRKVFPFIDHGIISAIEQVKYAKVIQVVLGFKHWHGRVPDGFGGLIPSREKRDILGILFISSLFPDRAPVNGALFSVFAGGVRREDIMKKTDHEIKEIVEREFSSIMELKEFNPDILKIIRYENAIPQYGVESRKKVEAIEKLHSEYPGLLIGGNLHGGIGMADRVTQGRFLADTV